MMNDLKYSRCIISDAVSLEPNERPGAGKHLEDIKEIKSTHLMNVDASRMPGFFYVDCYCLWEGGSHSEIGIAHIHDSDEVIGLVGTNPADPYDLGGEIALHLDGDKQTLSRSSLIYIPAGALHGPLQFLKIERPIYFFTVSPAAAYRRIPAVASRQTAAEKKSKSCTIISRTKEHFTVAADDKRKKEGLLF